MTPKQKQAMAMLRESPGLLWGLVDREGECWEWVGSTNDDGYGSVRVGPTSVLSHRAAYMLEHGDIEGGLCVCHSCDNPACCNVKHLFLGSHSANMQDMRLKGRRRGVCTGALNGRAKLTEDAVAVIREQRSRGASLKDLALLHSVGKSTISRACRGENWT